jgi:hypothetical protein
MGNPSGQQVAAYRKQAKLAHQQADAAAKDAADKADLERIAKSWARDAAADAKRAEEHLAKATKALEEAKKVKADPDDDGTDPAALAAQRQLIARRDLLHAVRKAEEARRTAETRTEEAEVARAVAKSKQDAAEKLDRQVEDATKDFAEHKQQAEKEERPEAGTTKEEDLEADDAARVRAEADAAREAADAGYEAEAKELKTARVEAEREKNAADRDVVREEAAAKVHIAKAQREVDVIRKDVARLNREAKDAGDSPYGDSMREQVRLRTADQRAAESAVAEAKRPVEEARQTARDKADALKQIDDNYRELKQDRAKAEPALDNLEQKARLLEQAQKKLSEADFLAAEGDPGSAAARREAERLVEQAERVHVDRAAIREVAPEFPLDPASASPAPSTPIVPGQPAAAAEAEPAGGQADGAPIGASTPFVRSPAADEFTDRVVAPAEVNSTFAAAEASTPAGTGAGAESSFAPSMDEFREATTTSPTDASSTVAIEDRSDAEHLESGTVVKSPGSAGSTTDGVQAEIQKTIDELGVAVDESGIPDIRGFEPREFGAGTGSDEGGVLLPAAASSGGAEDHPPFSKSVMQPSDTADSEGGVTDGSSHRTETPAAPAWEAAPGEDTRHAFVTEETSTDWGAAEQPELEESIDGPVPGIPN